MGFSGLRILLVGPLPPPAGGMASLTVQLRDHLVLEGAQVDLVQTNAPYRPAWAGQLKVMRALFRIIPYLAALLRACGAADVMHLMANSGWSWHLFCAPAIWVGALRGTPVVVHYHGGEAATFLARSGWWVLPTLRKAKLILVPSGFLAEVFARHGVDTTIVPNVVDLNLFSGSRSRQPRPPAPHILVARNLESIYGLDVAIRAFARIRTKIPAARLSLTGSGPELANLAALAASLGVADGVRFTGRLDRQSIADLFHSADLLLNPSRADNSPGALLEALAAGVPIVATRVGGVPYMVEHGRTALLVPVDDDVAMADAALQLLGDAGYAAGLARMGLSIAARHDWQSVRPTLLAAYQSVLQTSDHIEQQS